VDLKCKSQNAAHALFAGGGDDSNMPTTELKDVPDNGLNIIDLLIASKLAPSRGEARRLIQQGGITVDDVKVDAIDFMVPKADLIKGAKIRKGKKVYHKIIAN